MQGGLGVLQVGEHGPQPALDGVGRLVAEGFKGVARAEIGFGRQFPGEQQQQLTQLQGEAAAEQVWFAAGQAIEGQQQFLLQHPLPAVLTAEPLDHPGDAGAALGCADPGIAGVVPPHHHLLLAHQQVDEGILQLGMHQVEGTRDPSHHVPVGFGQGAAVDLLEQIPQSYGLAAGGPLQAGIGPQAPHQLLQHLPLFLQGRTAPEPLCQFADADVVPLKLLLLPGGEGGLPGAGPQGDGCRRLRAGSRAGLGRQGDPAALLHQLSQGGQLHGHAVQQARLQVASQPQKGLGVGLEGPRSYRHQQQR